jgi:integrase
MSTARGSVFRRKKSKTWNVQLDLGRDEEGKRRREWHGGYGSKLAAEKARTELLASVDAGAHLTPSDLTLREYVVGTWLPGLRTGSLRPSTVEMYSRSARTYLLPQLGRVKLRDLDPLRLKGWLDGLRTQGVGARTVQVAYSTAHRALRSALDLELIPRNPADNAEVRAAKPPLHSKAPTIWTVEETRAFLDHERDDPLFALWRLATMTGARRGELCGARWRDVDLDAGELHIRETAVVVNYRVVQSTPKTEASRRTVALDPATVAALRALRARQTEEMFAFGRRRDNLTHLFTAENGEPLHPQRLTTLLASRAKKAGLPVVRFHALRHGHATAALEAGVPMKVVSDRLGHSSIVVTANIYSHVTAATDRAAAAQIAATIDGAS